MKCPSCGSLRSHVVRTHRRLEHVYRRRECKDCEATWATKERPAHVIPEIERELDRDAVRGVEISE